MKQTLKKTSLLVGIASLALGIGLFVYTRTYAADNNLTNGITVDSTLDTADANLGDGACNDGSGNCTLRAAIEEANSDPDASTINFNISGTADFINGGKDGYTITPQTELPGITEQVTIDGYSQPDAQANTAVAPNPLNGRLLIEINGTSAGGASAGFNVNSNNTVVQGLAINRFSLEAVKLRADNVSVYGCYLGTDPTGLVAKGNNFGVAIGAPDSDGLQFGGLLPAERNLVSGNTDLGLSPNNGSDSWVVQGNYFGVDATGLAALPNAQVGGAGALSIDHSDNTIVGGSQTGAINVISGNLGHGIAPDFTDNLIIQGNYIGVGYDGVTALPNGDAGTGQGSGIALSNSTNVRLLDNIVSKSGNSGIAVVDVDGAIIQGNTVGAGVAGTESLGNEDNGILVGPHSYRVLIGGTDPSDSNVIKNNTAAGISGGFNPVTDSQFTSIGNSISNNNEMGIALKFGSPPFANDPSDSDTGPNGYLNYPVDLLYREDGLNTKVKYNIDVPAGDYRIEFFSNTVADASGNGEGETLIGNQNITSNGSGSEPFNAALSGADYLALTTLGGGPQPSDVGRIGRLRRSATPQAAIAATAERRSTCGACHRLRRWS